MTAIRIPDRGETPLSLDEQRFADEHGISCIRNRQPQYAWRNGISKPPRPSRGKTYALRQMLREARA